jgi:hypothetical protein
MKTKLLLASVAALGLASAVAWAGVNAKQNDTGGMCWEFTSGLTATEAWCWSSLGVLDFTPATTAADSAATNDSWEIVLNSPVDTTGTNTHNALTMDIGIGNATGGTNVVTGLQIDAITGDASVTTNGINIGAMTGTGGAENAIVIGTGWDLGISSGSGVTLDDGTTASPDLTFQDATNETAVLGKVDAGNLTVTTVAGDGLQVLTGNAFIGNGTPGETINGEDLYVEGISEFDGTANFDGAVDFDGTITVDTVALSEEALKFPSRGSFTVCGDATTVNANTVYYGPQSINVTSATVGLARECDTTAVGNVTEATADEPAYVATAFHILGMDCISLDPGAELTFTTRSAAAATVPSAVATIADNVTQGTATGTPSTTIIASGATFAVAVASASDITTANVPFVCTVYTAY